MHITNIDLTSAEARNHNFNSIDLMKFIFALLVIAIHFPPLVDISNIVNWALIQFVARLAVPFFFICSGYLLFRKTDLANKEKTQARIKRYTLRIIKMLIIWYLLYFPLILKNRNGGGW